MPPDTYDPASPCTSNRGRGAGTSDPACRMTRSGPYPRTMWK
jgi:hypothetical protein